MRLDERVATRLSQHKLADGSQFILHQHELSSLPGAKYDIADRDGPIWLRIQRLQRSKPPEVAEEQRPWIDVSNDPACLPVLRDTLHRRVPEAEQRRLLAEGEVRLGDCVRSLKLDKSDLPNETIFDVILRLEDRPETRAALEAYCAGPWAHWSEQEEPRRRSIAVYQRLFEIAQRLLQSGGGESIELIWGIGLSRWRSGAESIDLPMIECGVEIEIADTNADITIRPRGGISRVELRPFEKPAGSRFALAEDAARRCMRSLEGPDSEGISPFRQESFEPILKICGSQLDPEGRYLPDHKSLPATGAVPEQVGESLVVSDRYVLYARRRSSNSILRDIDQLKNAVSSEALAPPRIEGATRTLVLGPSDGIGDTYAPLGDRLGATDGLPIDPDEAPADADHGDLFFPKPFNDEQVEIIRRLEKSDGLVVQGPPGTGKTHTIANIISHMLATGRRVLVVSHGETALRVIQDQLPEGVRDLAISVTTSERDGLKQVEKAVGLMLGIVNTIDMNRGRQIKLIRDLETRIAANKNRLTEIDKELAALATPHMSHIPGAAQTAFEASKRLIENRARHEWFRDRPTRSLVEAGVRNADMEALFTARKTAKNNLKYLGERLPSCANVPDPETLRRWHQDLIAAEKFVEDVEGLASTRRVIARLGLDGAERLATDLKRLADGVETIKRQAWAWNLAELLLSNTGVTHCLDLLARSFLADAEALIAKRGIFLSRPVDLPNQLPPEKPLMQILEVLVEGKNPFGLLAFTARAHQPAFETVRVAGAKPRTPEDWRHVRAFIDFCADVTALSARWDALRPELLAPAEFGFAVWALSPLAALSDTLRAALISIPNAINNLSTQLSTALANDFEANAILQNPPAIALFADALSRHVASIRLSAVQQNASEAAAQFQGSDCDLARYAQQILTELIGKAELDAERLTQVWDGFRAQLEHIRALAPSYQLIAAHTDAIARAGAPIWAERLRTEPVEDAGDPAAPLDWSEAWEWARQLSYLESIGATADLARLHHERLATEKELRNGFAALVKERTFYNLAATMKGSAKAALQGFANIIRRLGAGTGQRAVLHRQNARQAMQGCYEAVPCWIMPTWRVSEQLPADTGQLRSRDPGRGFAVRCARIAGSSAGQEDSRRWR